MSASLENVCEQIEVLLLKGQPAFAGIQVVRQDENFAANKDRVVVSSTPREAEILGPDGATQLVIKIPITVSIHLVTRDAAEMDALIAGVNAAQVSRNAAAIALATTTFPHGICIRPTDGGDRKSAGNSRSESRVWHFIASLQSE